MHEPRRFGRWQHADQHALFGALPGNIRHLRRLRTLATASNDGPVKLWSVESRQELFTMPGHVAPWRQVAFSPNGDELVAAGEDGMLQVWRARSP